MYPAFDPSHQSEQPMSLQRQSQLSENRPLECEGKLLGFGIVRLKREEGSSSRQVHAKSRTVPDQLIAMHDCEKRTLAPQRVHRL